MKETLPIALIQSDLIWESPSENRQYFDEKIKNISEGVAIVILPEMFTSGFTMNASVCAESMDGPTVLWMQGIARKKNIAITGSVIIKEADHYYNRLLFVYPSGRIVYYDKKHTFTLVGEHKVYTAGTTQQIVDYKGWKCCLLVCYDLRFPVWSRNTQQYDVLIYVANWPKSRISAWDVLLKARAVENMCYSIGVNRVGSDGCGHEYSGHSAVYNVLGENVVHSENEEILYAFLYKDHIRETRERFGFLEDSDAFILV